MVKIKAIEISIECPIYHDEVSLTRQLNTFKKYLVQSSEELGVTVEDFYLDESTGSFVVRLESIEGDKFVGQFRLTTWVERTARKHLTYER